MFVVPPAPSTRLSLHLRCVSDPTNDPLLQNRFSVEASADPPTCPDASRDTLKTSPYIRIMLQIVYF